MTYKRPILGNTSVILFRLRTFGVGKTFYFLPFWIYNSTFWWPPLECSIRCLWINFNRFCIVFPFCLKTSFCFPSWYITIHGNFSIWNKLKLNYLRVKDSPFSLQYFLRFTERFHVIRSAIDFEDIDIFLFRIQSSQVIKLGFIFRTISTWIFTENDKSQSWTLNGILEFLRWRQSWSFGWFWSLFVFINKSFQFL